MNLKYEPACMLAIVGAAVFSTTTLTAALPGSYELERQVFQLPVSTSRKIDTKVLFNTAGQVLFSTSLGDENLEVFFQSPNEAVESAPVPAGFEVMLPAAMNASGDVVGKVYRLLYQDNYAEAGFVKFPGEDPVVADNLDATQSALLFVTDAGRMAGAQRFFPVDDFLPFVTTLESAIVPLERPSGYEYFEVKGLSASGEVLLFVEANSMVPPQRRLAVGAAQSATALLELGPGNVDPWSSAMNAAGGVATVVRDSVLGGAEIRFMSSAVRSEYRSVFSSGNYEEIFDFSLNALGQAVFVKRAARSPDQIVFADVPAGIVQSFEGYRPKLNDVGEVVFGRGGVVFYWDSRVSGSQPAPVPVNVARNANRSPELLAFNNAGRLVMSYFSEDLATQTLGIFKPVAPAPTPTPTPAPTPKPKPAPAPTPKPSPIEQRIEIVESQVMLARKIRNPRARQARLRNLNIQLRRLQKLNRFEQVNSN